MDIQALAQAIGAPIDKIQAILTLLGGSTSRGTGGYSNGGYANTQSPFTPNKMGLGGIKNRESSMVADGIAKLKAANEQYTKSLSKSIDEYTKTILTDRAQFSKQSTILYKDITKLSTALKQTSEHGLKEFRRQVEANTECIATNSQVTAGASETYAKSILGVITKTKDLERTISATAQAFTDIDSGLEELADTLTAMDAATRTAVDGLVTSLSTDDIKNRLLALDGAIATLDRQIEAEKDVQKKATLESQRAAELRARTEHELAHDISSARARIVSDIEDLTGAFDGLTDTLDQNLINQVKLGKATTDELRLLAMNHRRGAQQLLATTAQAAMAAESSDKLVKAMEDAANATTTFGKRAKMAFGAFVGSAILNKGEGSLLGQFQVQRDTGVEYGAGGYFGFSADAIKLGMSNMELAKSMAQTRRFGITNPDLATMATSSIPRSIMPQTTAEHLAEGQLGRISGIIREQMAQRGERDALIARADMDRSAEIVGVLSSLRQLGIVTSVNESFDQLNEALNSNSAFYIQATKAGVRNQRDMVVSQSQLIQQFGKLGHSTDQTIKIIAEAAGIMDKPIAARAEEASKNAMAMKMAGADPALIARYVDSALRGRPDVQVTEERERLFQDYGVKLAEAALRGEMVAQREVFAQLTGRALSDLAKTGIERDERANNIQKGIASSPELQRLDRIADTFGRVGDQYNDSMSQLVSTMRDQVTMFERASSGIERASTGVMSNAFAVLAGSLVGAAIGPIISGVTAGVFHRGVGGIGKGINRIAPPGSKRRAFGKWGLIGAGALTALTGVTAVMASEGDPNTSHYVPENDPRYGGYQPTESQQSSMHLGTQPEQTDNSSMQTATMLMGGSLVAGAVIPRLMGPSSPAASGAAKAGMMAGGKALAKTGAKLLPFGLGALAGGYMAYDRFSSGDTTGGLLEVASALSSIIPVVGTAAAIGLQGTLAYRDITGITADAENEMGPPASSLGRVGASAEMPGAPAIVDTDEEKKNVEAQKRKYMSIQEIISSQSVEQTKELVSLNQTVSAIAEIVGGMSTSGLSRAQQRTLRTRLYRSTSVFAN